MEIRGETIIITSENSQISEQPIMIRLISELRSVDDKIKTFCFRNELEVRLHPEGNYMIDLSKQLNFIVINIEKGFIYLSLPEEISKGQLELFKNCASLFLGDEKMNLYYQDKNNKEVEFKHKFLSKDEVQQTDFITNYVEVTENKSYRKTLLKKEQ